MAPLSFVRSILALSLFASALSRPTHILRHRHNKRSLADVLPPSYAAAVPVEPATSPFATVASVDSPAYGKYTVRTESTTTKARASKSVPDTDPTPPTEETPTPKVSAPAPTGTGLPSGGSSRVGALLPVDGTKDVVSYSDAMSGHKGLDDLPVTSQAKTSKFQLGTFEGRAALETLMNKDSISPGQGITGGISFYSPTPELQGSSHYLFSYSVFFQEDFDFNIGGKLPGTYGGIDEQTAKKCSGGKHDFECYSTRLMWREGGAGELYLYIPVPNDEDRSYNKNDQKCGKSGSGKCNGTYGYSIGRGTWTWTPGEWTTVAQRIKLNTVGKADGQAEIFVDGESVLTVEGLVYRRQEEVTPYGIQMQTFFGGHEPEWASPKDQTILFADMTVAILA